VTGRWLTPGQVAVRLGVHRKTVIRWCEAEKLEHWRTPSGRIRIPTAAVDAITRPTPGAGQPAQPAGPAHQV
jgi:excisionase family DNA binding protein